DFGMACPSANGMIHNALCVEPRKGGSAMTARLAAVAVLALLAVSSTAAAQGSGPEWDRMVAAAKQEGELVILLPGGAALRDFLAHEWPKAYPEITLSLSSMPGPQLMPRM